ncbi:MAG: class I SAM-dependent methyltransferase [Candidatus Omnitrophica bacterium]|nr:class I SAM-dependent methyltransferase [Candidatus Omnitrophota bacterium]MBU1869057.1 class I SAM-dependent methyltransferase [Candidatus Omnitrophota bacterium]
MFNKIYSWFHRKTSSPDQEGEYSAGFWQEKVRRSAVGFLRGQQGNILEIGCGEGLFLLELSRENPQAQIFGIDFSRERLKQAEEKINKEGLNNIHLSCQEAPRIDFEEGKFDAVACVNVFFNMPSLSIIKETLLQARRVLKKDGKLVFDFRNSLNPLLLLKFSLARFYDPTIKGLPLKTYSPAVIENALAESGFEILRSEFISAFLFKIFAPVIVIEAKKR